MEKKYEDFHEIAHVLGSMAVLGAMAKCGIDKPTLFVKPKGFAAGYADKVAEYCHTNLALDDDLDEYEWYVSWGGKRFGSVGC